jgi:hypothetical protein
MPKGENQKSLNLLSPALLHDSPILQTSYSQFAGINYLAGHQHRTYIRDQSKNINKEHVHNPPESCMQCRLTNRTSAIKSFREAPLRLGELALTCRDIVCRCIAKDIVKSISLRDIPGAAADNNGKFRLVIRAVVFGGGFRDREWSRGIC